MVKYGDFPYWLTSILQENDTPYHYAWLWRMLVLKIFLSSHEERNPTMAPTLYIYLHSLQQPLEVNSNITPFTDEKTQRGEELT